MTKNLTEIQSLPTGAAAAAQLPAPKPPVMAKAMILGAFSYAVFKLIDAAASDLAGRVWMVGKHVLAASL